MRWEHSTAWQAQRKELFEPEIVERQYTDFHERFDSMVDAVVMPRAICVGAAQWMLGRG